MSLRPKTAVVQSPAMALAGLINQSRIPTRPIPQDALDPGFPAHISVYTASALHTKGDSAATSAWIEVASRGDGSDHIERNEDCSKDGTPLQTPQLSVNAAFENSASGTSAKDNDRVHLPGLHHPDCISQIQLSTGEIASVMRPTPYAPLAVKKFMAPHIDVRPDLQPSEPQEQETRYHKPIVVDERRRRSTDGDKQPGFARRFKLKYQARKSSQEAKELKKLDVAVNVPTFMKPRGFRMVARKVLTTRHMNSMSTAIEDLARAIAASGQVKNWSVFLHSYYMGRLNPIRMPPPLPLNERFVYLPALTASSGSQVLTCWKKFKPLLNAHSDLTCLKAVLNATMNRFSAACTTVSFFDDEWEYVLCGSWLGQHKKIARSQSLAAHALYFSSAMVVLDAAGDWRFKKSLYVANTPHTRFFACAPILDGDGKALGVLTIYDDKPRDSFTPLDRLELSNRAASILYELETDLLSLPEARNQILLNGRIVLTGPSVYFDPMSSLHDGPINDAGALNTGSFHTFADIPRIPQQSLSIPRISTDSTLIPSPSTGLNSRYAEARSDLEGDSSGREANDDHGPSRLSQALAALELDAIPLDWLHPVAPLNTSQLQLEETSADVGEPRTPERSSRLMNFNSHYADIVAGDSSNVDGTHTHLRVVSNWSVLNRLSVCSTESDGNPFAYENTFNAAAVPTSPFVEDVLESLAVAPATPNAGLPSSDSPDDKRSILDVQQLDPAVCEADDSVSDAPQLDPTVYEDDTSVSESPYRVPRLKPLPRRTFTNTFQLDSAKKNISVEEQRAMIHFSHSLCEDQMSELEKYFATHCITLGYVFGCLLELDVTRDPPSSLVIANHDEEDLGYRPGCGLFSILNDPELVNLQRVEHSDKPDQMRTQMFIFTDEDSDPFKLHTRGVVFYGLQYELTEAEHTAKAQNLKSELLQIIHRSKKGKGKHSDSKILPPPRPNFVAATDEAREARESCMAAKLAHPHSQAAYEGSSSKACYGSRPNTTFF